MRPTRIPFYSHLTPTERTLGLIYLPVHFFALPILISMLSQYVQGIDDIWANLIYYAIGFVFCLTAVHGLLRKSFDVLLDNLLHVLLSLVAGFFVYMLLSYISSLAMLYLMGEQAANPNNQTASDLIETGGLNAYIGVAVFIAPVVEETLFRGALFGGLRERSRTAAYFVSIVVFSIYHVWQYALAGMDITVLMYALQYVPVGFALAHCYERTSCIWCPIFLHMFLNYMGATSMAG